MKYFLLFILLSFNANADVPGKFEIRTAPLTFFARWITLDATYILNEQWAFGPSYISYANDSELGGMLAPTYYGNAIGAHAIWAVDSLFTNSWYIGSHAYYEDYRSKLHAAPRGDDEFRRGTRVNAVLGFRQFNGSFLTMVGLGYETYSHRVESIENSVRTEFDRNNSWFHAEFKAGWMF